MKIEPYTHICTAKSGSMKGKNVTVEVTAHDAEVGTLCVHCRKKLATPERLGLHVYDQLTKA